MLEPVGVADEAHDVLPEPSRRRQVEVHHVARLEVLDADAFAGRRLDVEVREVVLHREVRRREVVETLLDEDVEPAELERFLAILGDTGTARDHPLTGDELPYTSTVVIDKFEEEGNLRRIAATIVVLIGRLDCASSRERRLGARNPNYASRREQRKTLRVVDHGAERHLFQVMANGTGFALFFHNYSTWLGKPGIWLEDLFVSPQHRGKGHGRALLIELARIAIDRGCGRVEWSVLDWNEPSIAFYRSLGALAMDEWTVYRMTGESITQLAGR